MNDDNNMLPNDGELFNMFNEPEEQVTDRRVQQSKAQAAKPMLEDIIAMFEGDIEMLKSVDSIPDTAQLDDAEFRIAWTMNQRLLEYAREKKSYLESLLVTTKR